MKRLYKLITILLTALVIVLFRFVFHINNYIVIEIAIDLVLAFVFSIFNYMGDRKQMIKDPAFHRNVAIYFIVLTAFSFLFMFF